EDPHFHAGDVHDDIALHGHVGQVDRDLLLPVHPPQHGVVEVGAAHPEFEVAVRAGGRGVFHDSGKVGAAHDDAVRGEAAGGWGGGEAVVGLQRLDLGEVSGLCGVLAG